MSGHVKHQQEAKARAILADALSNLSGPSVDRAPELIEKVIEMDQKDRDALPGRVVKRVKAAKKKLPQEPSEAIRLIREARAIMGKRRKD